MSTAMSKPLREAKQTIATEILGNTHDSANLTSFPLRTLAIAGLISVGALFVTVLFPGWVAYKSGVLYLHTMQKKIPVDAQKQLDEAEMNRKGAIQQLQNLEALLRKNISEGVITSELTLLFETKARLQKDIDGMKAPVVLMPYYLSPQTLLWPAIYSCLGWLIVLLAPSGRPPFASWRFRQIAFMAVLLYVFYEWPLWFRNFVLENERRVVYAYPNWDIDKASFFVQEGIILGFCILLACLWNQWSMAYLARRAELDTDDGDPLESALDARRARRLATTYLHWTVCSLVLALGFVFFTDFFWNLVGKVKDQRYLLSAVLAHLLWGVSWIFISLPLLVTWIDWNETRRTALEHLAATRALSDEQKATYSSMLREFEPISQLRFTTANLTAAISFLLPIASALHTLP